MLAYPPRNLAKLSFVAHLRITTGSPTVRPDQAIIAIMREHHFFKKALHVTIGRFLERERIAITTPAGIMHPAPSMPFNRIAAIWNRA